MSDLDALNKPESTASIMRRLRRLVRPAKARVTIVQAVEFRREAYGLTQSEFAELLGMQPSHYSEFVNGKCGLPIKAVRKAYALGVPPAALLQITKATQ